MLFVNRYINLRLKKNLHEVRKTKIDWLKYNNNFNQIIWCGNSKLYTGINIQYNICHYQSEINNFVDIIDYNYNMGVSNNLKLDTTFNLEQYVAEPVHNMIDNIYQTSLLNKIILGKMYHNHNTFNNSYKFVYFYQIDRNIDFYYKSNKFNKFIPQEGNIICFDTDITNIEYDYNKATKYVQYKNGIMGILIMTIQKNNR